MGKRTFRITRYKIHVNKAGSAKLRASKKGYICRAYDAANIEEMLENKHVAERISRDRADKERRNTAAVSAQMATTERELAHIRNIMDDAMELIRAHGSGDGVLIDRIEAAVNPKSKFARVWAAITGR